MADEDRGNDGPSLELPSFGLGRRKRKRSDSGDADATAPAAPAAPEPEPQPAPEPPATTTMPAEGRTGDDTPIAVTPPAARKSVEQAPEPPAQQAPPFFADEAPGAPLAPPPVTAEHSPEGATPTRRGKPAKPAKPAKREKPARARRQRSLPTVGGTVAAVITGLLIGVITVGLTWASQRLCEVVRGTSSCGGPGFFLLVAIMVAMVVLGAALLRAWGVSDPGSTSFLAVGLLAVVALLFLVDVLFNWWMIIVIPGVSVATFALSQWVTTTFIDPAEH